MKTKLSGLLDGELDKHDERLLFDALKRDSDLRDRWEEYLLIGEALKGKDMLGADIASRVMATLVDDPVVLAPRQTTRARGWQRSALALAATLAGVTVVGWMAFGTPGSQGPDAVALLAQNEPVVAQTVRTASGDMQEYLVAHQAQSSFLQFRGGTGNIRTVAATRPASAK